MTLSHIRVYSRARRITSALAIGCLASVKATAPPAMSSPISASSFPSRPLRHRSQSHDAAVPRPLGLVQDKLGIGASLDDGIRIRQRCNQREPTRQCSCGPGGDRFVFFETGFAETDAAIDESGTDDQSSGVDH